MPAASRFRLQFVVIAAVLALVAGACGDDEPDTTTDPGTSTTSPTTTTDTVPDTTEPPDGVSVDASLYFVNEVVEPAAGGVVEALAATSRTVETAPGGSEPEAALEELLAGPAAFETEIGFTTAIPEGTQLLGVEVEDGTATVDLDATFEAPSGAFTDTLRVAQMVFTLTAFDEIETVRFAIDGQPRDTVGTHGIDVAGADGNGVGRNDVSDARPPILVESPAPGGDVTDPMVITGEANTFEANVRWSLTDPEGLILDEGFTTATAGSGTWGTFEISVPTGEVSRGGLGAVILWEDSAEDGRQTNIVEIPVRWPDP